MRLNLAKLVKTLRNIEMHKIYSFNSFTVMFLRAAERFLRAAIGPRAAL